MRITITDERAETEKKHEFLYEGGIAEFVRHLNKNKNVLHPKPLYFEKPAGEDELTIEVALQYNDGYDEKVFSFANNINTVDGGTHLSGFRSALTRTINSYAQSSGLIKDFKGQLSGDDVREGLVAVIAVKLPQPQFEGQTKGKLNSDVQGAVQSFLTKSSVSISSSIRRWQDRSSGKPSRRRGPRGRAEGPRDRPQRCAQCKRAAGQARRLFRERSGACARFISWKAISAGGSAKQGRDRRTQAVLPLKGKILNVEKARFDKMLSHSEIKALITALGTGIGKDDFDIEKLRYHKMILMTDADVDGSHIRTFCLLSFTGRCRDSWRILRRMAKRTGYVYIAQPPLYKVKKGKSEKYIKDEREMNRYLMKKATEDLKVITKGGDTLEGRDLTSLLEKLVEFNGYYSKLERRLHDRRIVDIVLETLAGPKGLLRKEGRKLHDIFKDEALLGKVEIALDAAGFKTELTSDEEHGLSEIEVQSLSSGAAILIDWELATHVEFQRAIELHKVLDVLHEPPFTVKENGNEIAVSSRHLLLEHILSMAKKDLHIQRYKGLGEMNPEQLWETTMNPETRTLLQVKIDDVVETDEIFTVLMGDQVEPRRKFIEDNALDVKNLDI